MPTDVALNDWWVYVLRCADGTLYTGVAKDVARRLNEHNVSVKGAKYTRVRRPVELVLIEWGGDRSAALKREWAIKSLSRADKKQLIKLSALQSQGYADSLAIPLSADAG